MEALLNLPGCSVSADSVSVLSLILQVQYPPSPLHSMSSVPSLSTPRHYYPESPIIIIVDNIIFIIFIIFSSMLQICTCFLTYHYYCTSCVIDDLSVHIYAYCCYVKAHLFRTHTILPYPLSLTTSHSPFSSLLPRFSIL